jgi:hypothetical protein
MACSNELQHSIAEHVARDNEKNVYHATTSCQNTDKRLLHDPSGLVGEEVMIDDDDCCDAAECIEI